MSFLVRFFLGGRRESHGNNTHWVAISWPKSSTLSFVLENQGHLLAKLHSVISRQKTWVSAIQRIKRYHKAPEVYQKVYIIPYTVVNTAV